MNRARGNRGHGLALSFLGAALICQSPSAFAVMPLTRLRDVLELPRATLASNPPVHVRAVVTCADKSYKLVFVQDASAGIFMYEFTPRVELAPGDELEIRGVASHGLFSPMLDRAQIVFLGKTNLPAARSVSIASLVSGALVGDRGETEAVGQRGQKRSDHWSLSLAAGEDRCTVSLPISGNEDLMRLLDARVRVRGVAAEDFGGRQQLTDFQIILNDAADIETLARPAEDAFQTQPCSIADLARYVGRRAGEHRVYVHGVVTLHWPGRATIVQDSTGGVLLENAVSGDLKTGDEVNVAGFLASLPAGNRLRNAEVRVVGAGAEPAPVALTLRDAVTNENKLARLMARVVEWQPPRDGEVTIVLSVSNEFATAVLPVSETRPISAAFPPGATVEITGVVRLFSVQARGTPSLCLWLRGPSDLLLVHPPPPSPRRWIAASAATAGTIGALSVIAFVVLALRHRRVHTEMLARQTETAERFEEMERQLRRLHRDRQHISQELHDNIIQSIYSVGLGVEEARRLVKKNPERVDERLNVAVQNLNGIIRDVRAFIVGLEPKGLEGSELKTATFSRSS